MAGLDPAIGIDSIGPITDHHVLKARWLCGDGPLSQRARSRTLTRWLLPSALVHGVALLALVLFLPHHVELPPVPIDESVALMFEAPASAVARLPPDLVSAAEPGAAAVQSEVDSADAPVEFPAVPAVPSPSPVQPTPAQPIPSALPKRVAAAHPAPQRTPVPAEASPTVVAPTVAPAPLIPPHPVVGMETNRAPTYPEAARRRGEQGSVLLRVNVSAEGAPVEVALAATSGHTNLDSAAIAAVRQWRFVPATQAGKAVPAVAEVPIRFRLEN